MAYEKFLKEATRHGINTYEKQMIPTIKGLYSESTIWINKGISTNIEKTCILAEELGHYHTSIGDILDQSNLQNYKQEKRARNWAYERLIPLEKFVQAHKADIKNRFELAEYLEVTEEFLEAAIKRYQEKYGLCTSIGGFKICFEPLEVKEGN